MQGIEGAADGIDRLVAAIKGAAHDPHHPDGVGVAALDRLGGVELQPACFEGNQPRLHIEVSAKFVPADLGVGAHHQVWTAGLEAGGQAPLPPAPLEHQPAEHAALAGAGGGGADGGGGIGRMPEVGQDPQAALFELGGLGIFVFINHVFVGALLHQAARLGFHPGAHKCGQVEAGVAIKHQVVVHQLVGQIAGQPLLTEAMAGDLGCIELAQL